MAYSRYYVSETAFYFLHPSVKIVNRLTAENLEMKDRLAKLESEFRTLKTLIVEAVNGNKKKE